MERQKEYELRNKLFTEINRDVESVFEEQFKLIKNNFALEILFPLSVLEYNYQKKSDEAIAMGLFDNNENLILVNPLREAIFWYIKKIIQSERKMTYSYQFEFPKEEGFDYPFVEFVLRLHDEYRRGEQIREIRESSSKVKLQDEGNDTYSFYFPVIEEEYQKEMLYYYGLDDNLASKEEREIFTKCEMYLMNKIDALDLPDNPRKIYIYFNILNNMSSKVDITYFELCKRRIMSDLNKISTTSLESENRKKGIKVINSKDELARFLSLFYYLSRLCMQKYMLVTGTGIGKREYVCQYDISRLIALGKQVGISKESMLNYIDYFSLDENVSGGNFTEFPFIRVKEKIIWIPSSIALNDFQFSIVNGHYYKDISFLRKDETVSQSIVDYVINHCKKYSNLVFSSNYNYHVVGTMFHGKDLKSDIDAAIFDKNSNKLLIIECKWKENVYPNKENYIHIEDAFRKVYSNQLEKHQFYLEMNSNHISEVFAGNIDFSKVNDLDILYLFVDKRIQFHDNEKNRHAISMFMLAYLFDKNSIDGILDLGRVFSEIRKMSSKVKYERVKLREPVRIGDITVI